MSKNPVVYWELASHDCDATKQFLVDVFDWDVEYDENIGMWDFPSGEGRASFGGGGTFTLRKAKLPFLTIYIEVDDLDAKMVAIQEHGGHIVEGPIDVGNGSRICLFNEPSGVTLSILERGTQQES